MGIRGLKNWEGQWEKTFEGGSRLNLKELNEFKEEILGPLKAFKEKAGERGTPVGTVTEAPGGASPVSGGGAEASGQGGAVPQPGNGKGGPGV